MYPPFKNLSDAESYVKKHVKNSNIVAKYRYVKYPMPDGSSGGYRIALVGVTGTGHWKYRRFGFATLETEEEYKDFEKFKLECGGI